MKLEYIDAEGVNARTPYPALVDALREAFRRAGVAPVRHHHTIPTDDDEDITLLLMPAWQPRGDFGVKLANIARANAVRGLPTLHGIYVLFTGTTGVPRAVLDAGALTARRTAAASALASACLSRPDARTLLVMGTGRVATQLLAAHCTVRPIEEVRVWGRRIERAREVAREGTRASGVRCVPVTDLESGARGADIITSAIPSSKPVLPGRLVEPGTHVDLVGAFTPTMCEADTELIAKADQIWVDTREGAKDEAGDLIQAAEAGVFSFAKLAGDLAELIACEAPPYRAGNTITVFKSVGTALEDLAAAELCLRHQQAQDG